jgi:cardiolipin synthase A/B
MRDRFSGFPSVGGLLFAVACLLAGGVIFAFACMAAGCTTTHDAISGGGGGSSAAGGGGSEAGGGGNGGGGGSDALDMAQPIVHSDGGGVGTTSAVTIIVEPSDKAQALISAIQAAKKSIHMTMYLLTNKAVMTALIAKKAAGLDVEVVLNMDFPPGTDASATNAASYTTLTTASPAVPTVWSSSNFVYTHEKCVTIDGTTAWIMTMNVTQSSATSNREYLAVDTDPTDVAEAEAIFQADYNMTSVVVNGPLLVSPVNSRAKLVALIASATSTIDLEVEELSDTPIVTALTTAADAKIAVKIALPAGTMTSAQSSAVTMLEAHNIPVVGLADPYLHAKAIVVDGVRAYIGSENFTANSLTMNRELGLVIGAPSEVAKVLTTVRADFAAGTAL